MSTENFWDNCVDMTPSYELANRNIWDLSPEEVSNLRDKWVNVEYSEWENLYNFTTFIDWVKYTYNWFWDQVLELREMAKAQWKWNWMIARLYFIQQFFDNFWKKIDKSDVDLAEFSRYWNKKILNDILDYLGVGVRWLEAWNDPSFARKRLTSIITEAIETRQNILNQIDNSTDFDLLQSRDNIELQLKHYEKLWVWDPIKNIANDITTLWLKDFLIWLTSDKNYDERRKEYIDLKKEEWKKVICNDTHAQLEELSENRITYEIAANLNWLPQLRFFLETNWFHTEWENQYKEAITWNNIYTNGALEIYFKIEPNWDSLSWNWVKIKDIGTWTIHIVNMPEFANIINQLR